MKGHPIVICLVIGLAAKAFGLTNDADVSLAKRIFEEAEQKLEVKHQEIAKTASQIENSGHYRMRHTAE